VYSKRWKSTDEAVLFLTRTDSAIVELPLPIPPPVRV